MKPSPFEYYAPTTLDEALALMAEHGYDAKALAGGQSLIPMMNFRLAQPEVLVDLNNIADLSYIRPSEDGGVLIGAMTRYKVMGHSELIAERAPLLYEAMPNIATSQIRNRGTIGGSLAHADPSAELVAVAVALDARILIRSQEGERWVRAKEFFISLFTTALEPEELVIEIAIPPMPERSGWSLKEVARRSHDFALTGVAAVLTLDDENNCQQVKLVYLSAGDGPMEGYKAAEILKGQPLTEETIQAAAEIAAKEDIDPSSDIHGTAEYRRHLAKTLTHQALEEAYERAKNN